MINFSIIFHLYLNNVYNIYINTGGKLFVNKEYDFPSRYRHKRKLSSKRIWVNMIRYFSIDITRALKNVIILRPPLNLFL